jgi:6-phosphofructokinase
MRQQGWCNHGNRVTEHAAQTFYSFKSLETKHVGHATEIVRDWDLTSIDAVVIVGGDGTYGMFQCGFPQNCFGRHCFTRS